MSLSKQLIVDKTFKCYLVDTNYFKPVKKKIKEKNGTKNVGEQLIYQLHCIESPHKHTLA